MTYTVSSGTLNLTQPKLFVWGMFYFSSSSVVLRAFSALYVSGHHPHSLGYLCAKFHFCHTLHCWAIPWIKLVYSINHSLNRPACLIHREPTLLLCNTALCLPLTCVESATSYWGQWLAEINSFNEKIIKQAACGLRSTAGLKMPTLSRRILGGFVRFWPVYLQNFSVIWDY